MKVWPRQWGCNRRVACNPDMLACGMAPEIRLGGRLRFPEQAQSAPEPRTPKPLPALIAARADRATPADSRCCAAAPGVRLRCRIRVGIGFLPLRFVIDALPT